MSELIEVKVPDIGDFKDVPVIEVFVKPGDAIKVDDPICTLESDKAAMEVPSNVAGIVKEVVIQLGTKVSEGVVLIRVEAAAGEAVAVPAVAAAPATPPVAAPVAGTHVGGADIQCEMLVLGGGPGGFGAP